MQQRVVIRTEKSHLLIWGFVAVVVIVLSAISSRTGNSTRWAGLALLVLACGCVFLWLAGYKIVIANDTISYSELFKGTVSAHRDDIVNVQLKFGRFKHTIVINKRSGPAIAINTKPFSRADVQRVVEFLADKLVKM